MMKKTLLLIAIAACAVGTHASAQMLVINEVYPGGGSTSTTAAYHEDFVELLNTGTTSIDVTGLTLAYASSTQAAGVFPTAIGTLGASAISGSSILAAGGFLLINTVALATGGAAKPTADFQFTSAAARSASNGAVEVSNASGTILDEVGYGTSKSFEGTAAATASANVGLSLNRTNGVDTNQNSTDFTSLTPSPTTSSVAAMGSVPEPSTYVCMIGGVGALAALRFRRRCA